MSIPATPAEFIEAIGAFLRAPPLGERDEVWTEQFGLVLQTHAAANSYFCKSRENQVVPGEWLQIDHVLVTRSALDVFPSVVVEHENRGMGSTGAQHLDRRGREYIEWALWKLLAVRADLRVLVAYPEAAARTATEATLAKIIDGATSKFGQETSRLLIILGWWGGSSFEDPRSPWAYYIAGPSGLETFKPPPAASHNTG